MIRYPGGPAPGPLPPYPGAPPYGAPEYAPDANAAATRRHRRHPEPPRAQEQQ